MFYKLSHIDITHFVLLPTLCMLWQYSLISIRMGIMFISNVFGIYQNKHVIFLFISVVSHIHVFLNVDTSLYFWNKSYLVMKHYLFNTLLDSIYLYFFKTFIFIAINKVGLLSCFVYSCHVFVP